MPVGGWEAGGAWYGLQRAAAAAGVKVLAVSSMPSNYSRAEGPRGVSAKLPHHGGNRTPPIIETLRLHSSLTRAIYRCAALHGFVSGCRVELGAHRCAVRCPGAGYVPQLGGIVIVSSRVLLIAHDRLQLSLYDLRGSPYPQRTLQAAAAFTPRRLVVAEEHTPNTNPPLSSHPPRSRSPPTMRPTPSRPPPPHRRYHPTTANVPPQQHRNLCHRARTRHTSASTPPRREHLPRRAASQSRGNACMHAGISHDLR